MASTITTPSTLAPLPEIHEPVHSHSHNTDKLSGYLVVRTDWSGGHDAIRREPVAFFAVEAAYRSGESKYTNSYGDALVCVKAERAAVGPQQYAVIDSVYECGCRFIG